MQGPNSEKDMGTSDKVSPELKCPQISIGDIEDVPTIRLNKDGSTPKQIRDMMKVDGLTNDDVKSHLQVYKKLSSFWNQLQTWFLWVWIND